jgi:hypothetical protein
MVARAVALIVMATLFISYRRADTSGYAGRLADDLAERVGRDHVFRDVHGIAAGSDYVAAIDHAIAKADVLLAVIGRTWLTDTGADGGRRLDDPQDLVRAEIAAALRRGCRVIPVLVESARMPQATDLPSEIAPLASRQAFELTDQRWDDDVAQLAAALDTGGRRRRRRAWIALAILLVLLAGGAGFHWLTRVPDLAGTWTLPDGSHWVIGQRGRDLTVEEVHYESRQVWKKGTGHLARDAVEIRLQLVFNNPRYRYVGRFTLDRDARTLTGAFTQVESGQTASPITAKRR